MKWVKHVKNPKYPYCATCDAQYKREIFQALEELNQGEN